MWCWTAVPGRICLTGRANVVLDGCSRAHLPDRAGECGAGGPPHLAAVAMSWFSWSTVRFGMSTGLSSMNIVGVPVTPAWSAAVLMELTQSACLFCSTQVLKLAGVFPPVTWSARLVNCAVLHCSV